MASAWKLTAALIFLIAGLGRVSAIPLQAPGRESPAELFGPLFAAVQEQRIFPDGKSFADAEPIGPPAEILRLYGIERPTGKDALRAFVLQHFRMPNNAERAGLRAHVRSLWSNLTRPPIGQADIRGSELALPAAYVVPGGRFREIYYWDSYFTMLGLRVDGRPELVRTMVADFTSLIERYGFIPNGTRTYYLSRSQPPLFAAMTALEPPADAATSKRELAALRAEHSFWMHGESCARASGACEHVVRMPDGTLLNRYWDAKDTPRDESYAEDLATASLGGRPHSETLRDLRSAAESGWDFSSRWLADPARLETIRTTRIVPVDLNSLLWQLERTIAAGCARDRLACASAFAARANARAAAMHRYLWDANGRFADWDVATASRTDVLSAATVFPLFVGMATPAEAHAVAATIRSRLLAEGGLRTTLTRTGQQWDDPNGWAPLQWIAIDGLERYGERPLAKEIARRWIGTVDRAYRDTGRMLEKYDVEERKPGGGGEYPLQDGFGWTNGVTSAILARYPDLDPDRAP